MVGTALGSRTNKLLVIAGAFLFAYAPVLIGLWNVWLHSDEYSHGFFIIPIALYICWTKKEILADIPVTSSAWGLFIFFLSLVLYVGARYAGITTIASLTMVMCLVGLVYALYGRQILREVSFPLFLLLFMIPVPNQIYSSLTVPLQLFVSQISVTLVSLLGLPILRDGNVIHLPDRTLEVVQACSGLRSLITLLTLSLIMGYFTLRSNFFRILLVLLAIPVAIIVNIVRVVIMIVILFYYQYDLTEDSVHTIYGLVIFALALGIIFTFQRVLQIWDVRAE